MGIPFLNLVCILCCAKFTSERALNKVQFQRKFSNGKFLFQFNLSSSDRNLRIIDPSGTIYGHCLRISTGRKWMCSKNIMQMNGSNSMTLEVSIPISNESCGLWRCTYGRKLDIVYIKTIPQLGKMHQDETGILNFKGTVYKTVFVLSCGIFPGPVDSTVMFVVNYTTIDYIRLYHNKCYNKNSACTGDICECDYVGDIFQMKYIMKKTESVYTNTLFEVHITTRHNGKRFQMTLQMLFDGKEFKSLTNVKPQISKKVKPEGRVVRTRIERGAGIIRLELVIFLLVLTVLAIIVFRELQFCISTNVIRNLSSAFHTITKSYLYQEKSYEIALQQSNE